LAPGMKCFLKGKTGFNLPVEWVG